MGFFDEYPQESGGGQYVASDEKLAIAQAGIPFEITKVITDEDNVFEGRKSPRYVLHVILPNPETGEDEERLLPFPISSGVESRDRMLGQMSKYFDNGATEKVIVKLSKVGKAYILVDASA